MLPQDPAPIPTTPASASINRIRIVDLPGIEVDAAVRGAQAYHLLSGPALIRYAQAAGTALALPERLRSGDPTSPEVRRELPRMVDTRLAHPDPAVREAAQAIARRLGRNLGYILLTLQRGDGVNRAARPDWPASAWDDWADIERVWLGGGVISGKLGLAIIKHANRLLAAQAAPGESGDGAAPPQSDPIAPLTVARTPQPHNMAILGAGRYLPQRAAPAWHALCLDLGQTSAKRAVVRVEKNRVVNLVWLPSVPVDWAWRNDPDAGRGIEGRAVLDFVAGALVDGFAVAADLGLALVADVAVSIAAYTRGGTLLGNGIYARMHQVGDDARQLIADRVVAIGGVRPRLRIVHDGTAAATLHAGAAHGAVIVVGTALGVGFPSVKEDGLLAAARSAGLESGTSGSGGTQARAKAHKR